MGVALPQWLIGFQLALGQAGERVENIIDAEYEAKVWNYTKADGGVPRELDPAYASGSPEVMGVGKGFDFAASICDGMVLSPTLVNAFLKYSNPLYDEEKDQEKTVSAKNSFSSTSKVSNKEIETAIAPTEDEMLSKLDELRLRTRQRLEELDNRLNNE